MPDLGWFAGAIIEPDLSGAPTEEVVQDQILQEGCVNENPILHLE
jgi:hypothetical protein